MWTDICNKLNRSFSVSYFIVNRRLTTGGPRYQRTLSPRFRGPRKYTKIHNSRSFTCQLTYQRFLEEIGHKKDANMTFSEIQCSFNIRCKFSKRIYHEVRGKPVMQTPILRHISQLNCIRYVTATDYYDQNRLTINVSYLRII